LYRLRRALDASMAGISTCLKKATTLNPAVRDLRKGEKEGGGEASLFVNSVL